MRVRDGETEKGTGRWKEKKERERYTEATERRKMDEGERENTGRGIKKAREE